MRFPTNAFACGLLSFATSIAAQGYPSKPTPLSVRGRRADGQPRAHSRRAAEAIARPDDPGRERDRCAGPSASRAARAAPDGYTVILGNWTSHVGTPALFPIQQDVLKDFEPVARLPVSRLWVTGKTACSQGCRGTRRVAESKSEGHFRYRRLGQRGSHLRHLSAEFHRHPVSIRALPRRRAGVPGPDRWQHRSHLHGRLRRARIPTLGTDQGLRRRREWTLGARARRSYAERGRRRGDGPDVLEWAVGAEGHAQGGGREAQSRRGRCLHRRKMQQRMADLGMEILPREQQTPEALGAYHRAETEKWWPIIKAAGIKPE